MLFRRSVLAASATISMVAVAEVGAAAVQRLAEAADGVVGVDEVQHLPGRNAAVHVDAERVAAVLMMTDLCDRRIPARCSARSSFGSVTCWHARRP